MGHLHIRSHGPENRVKLKPRKYVMNIRTLSAFRTLTFVGIPGDEDVIVVVKSQENREFHDSFHWFHNITLSSAFLLLCK